MTRAALSVLAFVAWLLLAVLWAVWGLVVLLVVRRRRWRRKLIPDFPRLARILPGRPQPAPPEARRMTSSEKGRRLAQLAARDGLWCQECDRTLDLDLHHAEDAHPEVHHLVAWSLCRDEWWANELFNLCLLCGPCNRGIGAGTTARLERLRVELWETAA